MGFDDTTLRPCHRKRPSNIRTAFHIDKIQAIVGKFASEPFEVAVEFPKRNGRFHPVIIVPAGVKTPVAAKSKLQGTNKKHIETDDVYVRSLRSNNTPSTTKASWKGWLSLTEVCFDNREADIGRFMRRHLSGVTPDIVRDFATAISKGIVVEATTEDRLRGYLQDSEQRYDAVVKERNVVLPDYGAWEAALLLVGEDALAHSVNEQFLNLLRSANPRYAGWPVWFDTRGSDYRDARPYVFEGVWEALVAILPLEIIDFMRFDPNGHFYLRRALEDDITNNTEVNPLTVLDFTLPVQNCAEAIAVGNALR